MRHLALILPLATLSLASVPTGGPDTTPAALPSAPYSDPPARVVGIATGGGLTRLAVTLPEADRVELLDADGQVFRSFDQVPEPVGIEAAGGRVYLGSTHRGAVLVFDLHGRPSGALGVGDGEFDRPSSIAVSPVDGRIHVVDAGRAEIRSFDPVSLLETGSVGAGVLVQPADLAVAGDGTLLVADLLLGTVERFDAAGAHVGSFTVFGSDHGQTVRPTAVCFDSRHRVYVVDSFLDQVNVYDPTGQHLATLGAFGTGAGLMRNPLDVWVSPADGRVYVTDLGDRELEIFPALP